MEFYLNSKWKNEFSIVPFRIEANLSHSADNLTTLDFLKKFCYNIYRKNKKKIIKEEVVPR